MFFFPPFLLAPIHSVNLFFFILVGDPCRFIFQRFIFNETFSEFASSSSLVVCVCGMQVSGSFSSFVTSIVKDVNIMATHAMDCGFLSAFYIRSNNRPDNFHTFQTTFNTSFKLAMGDD